MLFRSKDPEVIAFSEILLSATKRMVGNLEAVFQLINVDDTEFATVTFDLPKELRRLCELYIDRANYREVEVAPKLPSSQRVVANKGRLLQAVAYALDDALRLCARNAKVELTLRTGTLPGNVAVIIGFVSQSQDITHIHDAGSSSVANMLRRGLRRDQLSGFSLSKWNMETMGGDFTLFIKESNYVELTLECPPQDSPSE